MVHLLQVNSRTSEDMYSARAFNKVNVQPTRDAPELSLKELAKHVLEALRAVEHLLWAQHSEAEHLRCEKNRSECSNLIPSKRIVFKLR